MKINPNFNFHSKCEKLNIINMSFTDDLLLFVKGDVESIELLMIVFLELSSCTHLFVNPAKCLIYFGNIEDNIKMKIAAFTNYHEGKLPFRYFGIPLTSKKNLFITALFRWIKLFLGSSIGVLYCLVWQGDSNLFGVLSLPWLITRWSASFSLIRSLKEWKQYVGPFFGLRVKSSLGSPLFPGTKCVLPRNRVVLTSCPLKSGIMPIW